MVRKDYPQIAISQENKDKLDVLGKKTDTYNDILDRILLKSNEDY